ncbi:MAG: S24 family peptidase [Burkholderiaceae bacterium]
MHDVQVEYVISDIGDVFTARLKEARGERSVAEFARLCQVSHSTLLSYEKGALPGWENAVKIARAAGRPLDWFSPSDWAMSIEAAADALSGVTEQVSHELVKRRGLQPEDFSFIPLFDVRASAGNGAWNDAERVSKQLAFRREWISAELRASPDHLVLIYVDGDSMEPTLSADDVVMVDRSQLEVHSDSIFVFQYDGGLLIKRLQRLPHGEIQVISDNPRFNSYKLDASDFDGEGASARMIGRVVWGGIRL